MLTSLLKQVIPAPASQIKLVLGLTIWIAYAIAKEFFGAGAQFETVIGSSTELLTTFLGFISSAGLSSFGYKILNQEKVPVLGSEGPERARD